MKYVLLFFAEGDDVARDAAMSQDQVAAQYAKVGAWFAENGPRITGGNQLSPPEAATTANRAERALLERRPGRDAARPM